MEKTIKICYCYRDFTHCNLGKLFKKDNFYEFCVETPVHNFWVIYDKNGESGFQGYRFHSNKSYFTEPGEKVTPSFGIGAFYKYFDDSKKQIRKKKLNKINLYEIK
jgi:hypothetical protein